MSKQIVLRSPRKSSTLSRAILDTQVARKRGGGIGRVGSNCLMNSGKETVPLGTKCWTRGIRFLSRREGSLRGFRGMRRSAGRAGTRRILKVRQYRFMKVLWGIRGGIDGLGLGKLGGFDFYCFLLFWILFLGNFCLEEMIEWWKLRSLKFYLIKKKLL